MLHQIRNQLGPVKIRQRIDRALRWGTIGLIVGAIVASACFLLQWRIGVTTTTQAWLGFFSVLLTTVVSGFAWPSSWTSSARLVDSVYGLKDRTLTALDFAARQNQDPLQSLQVEDAINHLSTVDAKRVLPWRTPQLVPIAIATCAMMIGLAFLPTASSSLEASVSSGPLEIVLDQAATLEETMLKDLEELVEETNDQDLKELAEEMEKAIEDLKKPEVDQREALAQLSEMQAQLAAAIKQMDVQQVDAQLQQLAEALQVADQAQAASQSLKESDYDQAAEELEKIDASTMSRKQRDAVASNLAKLSKKLGNGKKGQLGEAVQEMADGLESENSSKCKSGMCKAAGVCRKQGLKKKISECLNCQLNRLSECKGCCQGQCNKPGNKVAKSDSPSNSAGKGASNKPFGDDKTKLDSNRRDEDLTGIAGEGPSERETSSTAEAKQDASRGYNERYTEYRKQMEEVLDSEPLPLGHRKTVRKYFESIRPTNAESESITE